MTNSGISPSSGETRQAKEVKKAEENHVIEQLILQSDLDGCPRCGLRLKVIVWGKTNCPNCGLHFECC